jgi:succinyl-diaminopimelate desuccinylase
MSTISPAQLAESPELRPAAVARVLAELVATPSVNPADGEAAMAERVGAMLAGTRCEVTLVESLPGRPSVAAVLRGRGDGPRLVLNGHMDTVSPGERARWTVDPFGGEERDASIWGRGATDMKGGLACQIACARALSGLPALSGSLVLHFAVGEERGEPGTRSLIERGFVGDWGIVTEPTDLRVAVAQRGTAWYRVTIAGRATHAGTRERGDNPTLRLGTLLEALVRYDDSLAERTHPLLGRALCTPTAVSAGAEANVVPEAAEVIVDRRMVPGETSTSVLGELRAVVDELNAADPVRPYRVDRHLHTFEPAEVPADSPFVRLVQRAAGDVGSRHRGVWGTPWGSDVTALVNDAGMEAVTFGPGDPDGCHAPDERCSIERLGQCATALARVAAELLD